MYQYGKTCRLETEENFNEIIKHFENTIAKGLEIQSINEKFNMDSEYSIKWIPMWIDPFLINERVTIHQKDSKFALVKYVDESKLKLKFTDCIVRLEDLSEIK